jgi:cytoskeleton protein RodZ
VSASPPYRLVARTTEKTWIRVRTEDGHATEEEIPAGQTREWVSNRQFTLTVGNAGGLSLELNGQHLPALGARGEVVRGLVLPGGQTTTGGNAPKSPSPAQ